MIKKFKDFDSFETLKEVSSPTYGKYYQRAFAIIDYNEIYIQYGKNWDRYSKMCEISEKISDICVGGKVAISYLNASDKKVDSPTVLVYYAPFLEDNIEWTDDEYFKNTKHRSKTLPVGYRIEKVKEDLLELKEKYLFEILI